MPFRIIAIIAVIAILSIVYLCLARRHRWNNAMETAVLLLFSLILIACVATKTSVLYALVIGYFIFAAYALLEKYKPLQILRMSAQGILAVKNVLITLLLIGMLTALWRASGTIPTIVCYAAGFISPSIFLLVAFLLNCMVSFLLGTAFGTAATMGAICMTMALTLKLDPVLVGGAILSGAYFGDRCSPVSTSALLTAELTGTNIFVNIIRMVKTSAVPFCAACLIYTGVGFLTSPHTELQFHVQALFAEDFILGWLTLLPAMLILLLSLLRINVKKTMLSSILCSALLCVFYQGLQPGEVFKIAVLGYHSTNPDIAGMISGGGIVSMVKVVAIVCLSSSYAGIFKETGLLDHLKLGISHLAGRCSAFAAILVTSVITGMIACNQTLAIMLTEQLCDTVEPDKKRFAIHLENTVVVVAPLIPWSIAGGAPLASMGAPAAALLAACYLYLLPLWNLIAESRYYKKSKLNH